jgi:hypothetical protein
MPDRTMTTRPFATFLGLVCMAGVLPACAGAGKHEASTLIDAVDRYRKNDGPTRDVQVQAVTAVACTDERVCAAKRTCVSAIQPTAQALDLKDEVAARLADIEAKRLDPTAPEATALPGKLDAATRLLGEGRAKMGECERQLTDLAIAFSL